MFNTVGPRQTGRYGMVVPTLVRQALSGQPLTVYGDGTAAALLLPRPRRRPRARPTDPGREDLYGEVFNIGSTEEVTILHARGAGSERRPGRARTSCSSRTTRPTARASRTCRARAGPQQRSTNDRLAPGGHARSDPRGRDRARARAQPRRNAQYVGFAFPLTVNSPPLLVGGWSYTLIQPRPQMRRQCRDRRSASVTHWPATGGSTQTGIS